MTRLQHIPSLLHWFTQVAYWTLLINNMHHSSLKNSNTHKSLWLLRSKWTHQSIYVKWNPVSHSKYSSVTTIFSYNLPPLYHKGILSLWTSFGNTCVHFLTLLYQIPSVWGIKLYTFFSLTVLKAKSLNSKCEQLYSFWRLQKMPPYFFQLQETTFFGSWVFSGNFQSLSSMLTSFTVDWLLLSPSYKNSYDCIAPIWIISLSQDP